jgi:hypothetical protein
VSERLESLDPDLTALLRQAEPFPEPPDAVRMRVHDALTLRIAASAIAGSSEAPDAGAPAVPPPSNHLLALASKPAWIIAATFAAGTATGAAIHAALQAPRERIVDVERPLSPVLRSPPDATPALEGSSRSPIDVSPAPARSSAPERNPASAGSDLGVEQMLLDSARKAMAQGRTADALAPLERHARRYPKGLLAEEREALAINVLVTLGRYDEARERSARFLRRYPGSLLRASVEAAVTAIP